MGADVETVGVFGDWHHNGDYALRQLQEYGKRNDRLVQVGDFGIWPERATTKNYKMYLNRIDMYLKYIDKDLYFLDGNHEHFPLLYSYPVNDDGFRQVAERIFHIPRGHSWEWGNQIFMGLGGAVSIDRDYRVPGHSWFPEEEITDEDVEKALETPQVDYLFTHDSLVSPLPPKSFGFDIDQSIKESQKKLSKVVTETKPSVLVHGHFHHAYKKQYGDDFLIVGLSDDHGPVGDNYFQLSLKKNRIRSV